MDDNWNWYILWVYSFMLIALARPTPNDAETMKREIARVSEEWTLMVSNGGTGKPHHRTTPIKYHNGTQTHLKYTIHIMHTTCTSFPLSFPKFSNEKIN